MKNTIRFLGIIALAMVIGFSMIACGDDSSSGGGASGGGGSPGKLTITGLPSAGDYVVYVFPNGYDLSTIFAVTSGIAGDQIAVGPNRSGNVFDMINYPGGGAFTGTGSRPVVLQNLNTDDPYGTANPMFRRGTVNFTNGGAMVSYNNFTVVTAWF